jgi:starch phosphorylase
VLFFLLFQDISAQEKVDETYKSPNAWVTKSILSAAGCGKFSCDRTIKEYAENIWNIRVITG